MKIWNLIWYDVLKSIFQSVEEGKNDGSSVSLDEPSITPKCKYYVIVTKVNDHHRVEISRNKDTSAIRCEECDSLRQAEHLAELARIMYYKSYKF